MKRLLLRRVRGTGWRGLPGACCLAVVSLWTLPVSTSASAGEAAALERSEAPDIRALVPRQIQVSLGPKQAWGQVRSRVLPRDLGEASWAKWDKNDDGFLSDLELRPLGLVLRARETDYLCLALAGRPLPFVYWRPEWVRADGAGPPGIDAALELRLEARVSLQLKDGPVHFVLYDRPSDEDGVVPVRFSLAQGLAFGPLQAAARAEMRGERRLEVVLSRAGPALWGEVVVEEARVRGNPAVQPAGGRPE